MAVESDTQLSNLLSSGKNYEKKPLMRGRGIHAEGNCRVPAALPARARHVAAPPPAASAPRSAAAAPAPAASAAPSRVSAAVGTGGTGQHPYSSPQKLKVLFLTVFGETPHPATCNAPHVLSCLENLEHPPKQHWTMQTNPFSALCGQCTIPTHQCAGQGG